MNPVLPRVAPFIVFIAMLAIEPVLRDVARSFDQDPRWWYAARVALVLGLLVCFWKSYAELGSVLGTRTVDWLLSTVLGAATFVLWVNLDIKPLTFGGVSGYDPRSPMGTIDGGLAASRFLGATLVTPIVEEVFWRSFLLRWLEHRDFLKVMPSEVGIKPLAMSALLFGLEHDLWFAGFLAGLGYGWLYMHTGSLWTAIGAHAFTNALLGVWVLTTGNWQFW
jgi:CAAX prenyl protease-like protein